MDSRRQRRCQLSSQAQLFSQALMRDAGRAIVRIVGNRSLVPLALVRELPYARSRRSCNIPLDGFSRKSVVAARREFSVAIHRLSIRTHSSVCIHVPAPHGVGPATSGKSGAAGSEPPFYSVSKSYAITAQSVSENTPCISIEMQPSAPRRAADRRTASRPFASILGQKPRNYFLKRFWNFCINPGL